MSLNKKTTLGILYQTPKVAVYIYLLYQEYFFKHIRTAICISLTFCIPSHLYCGSPPDRTLALSLEVEQGQGLPV